MPFLNPRIGFGNDTAVHQALQTGDYQGYLNAIEANWQKYKAGITQDKFNTMSEKYNNMTANKAAMQKTQDAITKSIQDNSYQEWSSAIATLPKKPAFTDNITADNFATYVQLYNAQQNKDWTTVQTLTKQLGINYPMMHGAKGNWQGQFMHRQKPAAQ